MNLLRIPMDGVPQENKEIKRKNMSNKEDEQ